jgi:hypothetical protein
MTRKALLLLALSSSVSLALGFAAQSGDEPETRRIPQFENDHVKVWKSIIVPNQPLSMHRHEQPRTVIALQGGTLTFVTESGETHDMAWETGKAYWLEVDPFGEPYGEVNKGTEPIEVIVVEMKGTPKQE